jgi:hypothetical protein
MGPFLLKSTRAIYIEICKHGRCTSLEVGDLPEGKGKKRITKAWAHDTSPDGIKDFLAQFTTDERHAITDGLDTPAKKKGRSAASWVSTALARMSDKDREELLAELQGAQA